MNFLKPLFLGVLSVLIFGCGKEVQQVKQAVQEAANAYNVEGHWLMVESDHSNDIEKIVEKESMVLTFNDKTAAFSPVDTLKGKGVFTLLEGCNAGPRPYKVDKNQLVFEKFQDCEEVRVDIEKLDGNTLKFADPTDRDTIRTFTRIDEDRYNVLVRPSDRKPE